MTWSLLTIIDRHRCDSRTSCLFAIDEGHSQRRAHTWNTIRLAETEKEMGII